MKKIYPYMVKKKQINVNLSKKVLEAMDKCRNEVDDILLDKIKTRSQFIQTALISYMGNLIILKRRLGGNWNENRNRKRNN